MPDIENLLREELKRTARKVQPGILRPLRVPAPDRSRRRRLLPLAAAAAVIAVITVVALVVGLTAAQKPAPSGPAPAALPRFYVTTRAGANSHEVAAVVRASASGQVTGTVQVPSSILQGSAGVTAAADDRSFIIGAYEGLSEDSSGGIRLDLRLFQFRISGGGKPGHLTELAPSPARGLGFKGIALSPDGKLLAVSLVSGPDDSTGTLQVINLATGTIRTWTAPVTGPQYAPGAPAWVDGNRMIAFTWLRSTDQGTGYVTEGVRLLDTAAPGDNLADAKLIVPSGVVAAGAIKSALITPDGRDVIAVTLRDLSPLASSHTVIVQFAELQAGTGGLIRVLRTQTARLDQDAFASLQATLEMLSFDSAGQYVLVQGIQFGRLEVGGPDPGRFTPLPLPPAAPFVWSAAW
jgi:hypothetical protein